MKWNRGCGNGGELTGDKNKISFSLFFLPLFQRPVSDHCDSESVKQSLAGQAVSLLRESLSEAGTMCESSAAICLTAAVSRSHSSESPPFTAILRVPGRVIGLKMVEKL